jgi:hypothetical protein
MVGTTSFDYLRADFWRLVPIDPVVGIRWNPANSALMRRGQAPFSSFGVGGRIRYELDHILQIQDYGAPMVYYLPNLRVVSASPQI